MSKYEYDKMEAQMLPSEIISEIALHSDYDTTLKLIGEYRHFDNDKFWKLKCETQFPNRYYFNSLTGKENYLVQIKENFLLPVAELSIDDYGFIADSGEDILDNYVYEYMKILTQIHFLKKRRSYYLLPLILQSQFILVRDDNCHGDTQIIGQYDTHLDAINSLKSDQLAVNSKYSENNGFEIGYLIFDLQYFIPYFTTGELKISTLKQNKHFTFHRFVIGSQPDI